MSALIGFSAKTDLSERQIIRSIERCILYHFMVSDIKNSEKRDEFRVHDTVSYEAGGKYIEAITKKMLSNPRNIDEKISEEQFVKLIDYLLSENHNPHQRTLENGKNKNDKRRILKFYEKILMFYYYKDRLSINQLNNEFSIEHIFPNSSDWKGLLDKDRLGNLFPIISEINFSRGNKHIDSYYKGNEQFFDNIKNIIPKTEEYNQIIVHENRRPSITNNDKYNEMCKNHEEEYKNNFIKCLFK